MSTIDIANLEHAGRSAMAWVPEAYDGRTHYGALLAAVATAAGILGVAAAFLISSF